MNTFPILLGALCVFALAYRYYSAFIAAKVLVLDDRCTTPSHTYEDGHNYVPSPKWVLFGHHFAAIAGAGPLVGPTLAAQFGFAPGFLWILIGAVLAGCVHDFTVLVVLFAWVGRNEPAHDDVLLETAEVIDLAVDGGFGEHACRLLEAGRGDERIGGERGLGDTEQDRFTRCRAAFRFDHAGVLLAELELIDHLVRQELGVADVLDPNPAHHLARDHFKVLIVDVDTLQAVDFLDLIDQVFLQFLFAEHGEDVVRIARAVHQRIAGTDALAFRDVDVNARS